MTNLYLSGLNGYALPRSVFVDEEEIGTVKPSIYSAENPPLWEARDISGRLHGDRYLSDWDAATQLALALTAS